MEPKLTIGVSSGPVIEDCTPLLRLLERLLSVKFAEFTPDLDQHGTLLLGKPPAAIHPMRAPLGTILELSQRDISSPNCELREKLIQFADVPEVPFPFRGRSLLTLVPKAIRPLTVRPDETVLALCERGAIWAFSQRNGVSLVRSCFPLPPFSDGGSLLEVFSGARLMELLPVIHWLRTVSTPRAYENPPLRACFIFDDPNLHWPHYGHVDFREIALHAARHNYHVSFATVPMDAWFTHRATARLFLKNCDRISLSIHGNNHTYRELARPLPVNATRRLLRQAITRTLQLESTTHLQISRVMIPPHGALSEDYIKHLPQCGFEAACNSHGSLRANNRTAEWTQTLGYFPAEQIQDCPVLPRWSLSGPVNATILLAAYLGQPILLRGHHQDLASGLEQIDTLADFINSIGSFFWAPVEEISRITYKSYLDGETFRIIPFSNLLKIHPPPEITRIVVDNLPSATFRQWKLISCQGTVQSVYPGQIVQVPSQSTEPFWLQPAIDSIGTLTRTSGSPPLAVVRRLLAEARDRLTAFRIARRLFAATGQRRK